MIDLKCFCGGDTFHNERTVDGFHGTVPDKLKLVDCKSCGVTRQITEAPNYVDDYHDRDWKHSYDQDREVAKFRLEKYKIPKGLKYLDIGSNNGAFVDEARAQGYEAWGVEPGAKHFEFEENHTYDGFLHEQNLPTNMVNAVVLHDVVEHVEDPLHLMKEVARVCCDNGTVIVDVPGFFEEGGHKHWKKHEHIWFFKRIDMFTLFDRAGIDLVAIDKPIVGKIVVYGKKRPPSGDYPILYLPSGVGDIYWALTKLDGLIEEMGWETPIETKIWLRGGGQGRSRRSGEYLIRDPRISFKGYAKVPAHMVRAAMHFSNNELQKIDDRNWIFAVNGPLSPKQISGRPALSLEEIKPEWPVDWYPKLWNSLRYEDCLKEAEKYADHFSAYFLVAGFYRTWFTPDQAVDLVKYIHERSGKRIVTLGARWDVGDPIIDQLRELDYVDDMTGNTTLEMAQAIQIKSRGVFGIPSGLTITGAQQGAKFACLWGATYKEPFWRNMLPPDADYKPFDCRKGEIPKEAVARFLGI